MTTRDFQYWLIAARNGDPEALGQLLNRFRDDLLGVAEESLDSEMRVKVSPSDLVQNSLIEAYRDFADFRGQTEQELQNWLSRILGRNLLNEYRFWRETLKRQLAREERVDAVETIASPAPSPSQVLLAQESIQQFQQVLSKLPEDYQTVLLFRHRDQLTFPEIGERLGRNVDAVRMLWYRAFDRLSQEMGKVEKLQQ